MERAMHFPMVPILALEVLFAFLIARKSSAEVLLIGTNFTLAFEDKEANFASSVEQSGICGTLHVSEPSDACSPLLNKPMSGEGTITKFVLIKRGKCSFESKVRNAQDAGFHAAIIYNNEDSNHLIEMGGNPEGIRIHAVFVVKIAGKVLQKYSGDENIECCIIPSREDTTWTVILIAFISLLALSAVLAICVCVRRYRLQHRRRRPRHHILSSWEVKALPSLTFTSVVDDNGTSETCAVCLEDYTAGEKLRVLPCHHKFHVLCIDSWLTRWRTFCPVCKRDIKTTVRELQASEHTPLLSSSSLITSHVSTSPVTSNHSSLSEHISSTSLPSYVASSYHSVSVNVAQSFGSLPILYSTAINIRNVSRHSSLQSIYSHTNSLHIGGSFISSYISSSMPGSHNALICNDNFFDQPMPSSSDSTSTPSSASYNSLPDN